MSNKTGEELGGHVKQLPLNLCSEKRGEPKGSKCGCTKGMEKLGHEAELT